MKIMSLGTNCGATVVIPEEWRVLGPIDNVASDDSKPVEWILSNTLIENVFYKNTIHKWNFVEWRTGEKAAGVSIGDHMFFYHNFPNFIDYDLVEFCRRCGVAEEFVKHIQEPDHFFVYLLRPQVTGITNKEKIRSLINILTKYDVLNKTIFVQCTCEEQPEFNGKFLKEQIEEFNLEDKLVTLDVIRITDSAQGKTEFKEQFKKLIRNKFGEEYANNVFRY